MPIYEYFCKMCGRKFEFLSFTTDDKPKNCKFCKSSNIDKIISSCSFVSSGSEGEKVLQDKTASSSSCVGCSTSNCAGCK